VRNFKIIILRRIWQGEDKIETSEKMLDKKIDSQNLYPHNNLGIKILLQGERA